MDTTIVSTTRRGFLKTMAVGAGGCALGSLLIHPEQAMGQSGQGCLGKLPMETRWEIAANATIYYQINFWSTVLAKEGRAYFDAMTKKNAFMVGAADKGRFADRLGLTGNDPKSAASIITAVLTAYEGPNLTYDIEAITPRKTQVKSLSCPIWNAIQARKITENLCSNVSHYYWAGFANAIDPNLTANLVKARPLGDPVCEWVVELKA